jgi:hypothetical protein
MRLFLITMYLYNRSFRRWLFYPELDRVLHAIFSSKLLAATLAAQSPKLVQDHWYEEKCFEALLERFTYSPKGLSLRRVTNSAKLPIVISVTFSKWREKVEKQDSVSRREWHNGS